MSPTTLTPFLTVSSSSKALEFYTAAFGAVMLARYEAPGGKLVARLAIEGAEWWLGDEEPEFGNLSPDTLGGSPVRMALTVADPDAIFNRAVEAGATAISPVTTEEAWRIGKLRDPFGHIWEVGHPLAEGE